MAVDYFINLGSDIKGESKDKAQGPNGDVDVLKYGWGATNDGTTHDGSGGGGGKAEVQDFWFDKFVDSATPAIALACLTGKHIDECDFLARKAGGGQEPFLKYKFEDCIITSIGHGGVNDKDDRPTERVTLNFAKITIDYLKQDEEGVTKSVGEKGYDIAGNAPI
jgi:type VI secretion system secreted protein Hcp